MEGFLPVASYLYSATEVWLTLANEVNSCVPILRFQALQTSNNFSIVEDETAIAMDRDDSANGDRVRAQRTIQWHWQLLTKDL